MVYQNLIKIGTTSAGTGGYSVPDPSEYEATTATIVNSARNAQGVVIGTVIRNNISKVSMKWKFISASDWANILKCFNPDYSGNFYNYCKFFLQDTNTWVTKRMYVSDRTAKIFIRSMDNSIMGYEGASLSLIEV